MTQEQMKQIMEQVFDECMKLREAGQSEYAGGPEADAFANFDRVARDLNIPGFNRKHALWTYFVKHRDGVASFLQGRRLQREDVRGRINDMIVYLCLLRGMIEEEALLQAQAQTQAQREHMRREPEAEEIAMAKGKTDGR